MAGLKLKLTQSQSTSEAKPGSTKRKSSLRRPSTLSTASDGSLGESATTTHRASHHGDGRDDRSSNLLAKDLHEANEWIVQRLKSIKDIK